MTGPIESSKQVTSLSRRLNRWPVGIVFVAAVMVAATTASISYGQKAPAPPPAPEVSPEPPDLPEPPDPPEPPERAMKDQLYILNDGAMHLGVSLSDVTAEKAHELKLSMVAGAIIDRVEPDSAAEKAGLHKGDVITEFDGEHVRSSAELRRLIRETPSGRTVPIKIFREGTMHTLSAKLVGENNEFSYMPNVRIPPMKFKMPRIIVPPMNFDEFPFSPDGRQVTLGIAGDDLTPQLAHYFGVQQGNGVLVAEVTKGGPADAAGLKAGDVITAVDAKAIGAVEELRHALNDDFTGDARKVRLTVIRDRHQQTIDVELKRTQIWEKRTASAPDSDFHLQQLPSQLEGLRAPADQLRADADRQRSAVKAEVLQQQKYLNNEWRQQVQQQVNQLKNEIRKSQDFRFEYRVNNEI